jgi:hypothetical protein
MSAKMNLSLLVRFAGVVLPAFAQIDGARFASDLRTKYGPPLARETFVARPGLEMVVDYAANGHVCRIQLPPIAPSREPGVQTAQAVNDFLAELVPMNMRGKELGRMMEAVGLPSMSHVEYQNVTVSELWQGEQRTAVTVAFKNEVCRKQAVP